MGAARSGVTSARNCHSAAVVHNGPEFAGVGEPVACNCGGSGAARDEHTTVLAVLDRVVRDEHGGLRDDAIAIAVRRRTSDVADRVSNDADLWIADLGAVEMGHDSAGRLRMHVGDGVAFDQDVGRRNLDIDRLIVEPSDRVVANDDI